MSGYRILSFDGGPAALTVLPCLIELERKSPGVLAATDLFVGASSGSWTALYLARNMGLVDAGEITGLELLERCLAFLKEALAAMRPADPVKAWLDFMGGEAPLLGYQGVQQVMVEPANYGEDTLGSLTSRRVVVIAGRMSSPWSPRVYDSADPQCAGQLLYDVGLCSGSFPMVYPIRAGQVDGAMYTNNPAMVGLVQALAGAGKVGPVSPADARVLTLGLDDGCSHLSNLFLPGSRVSDAEPQSELGGAPPKSLELAVVHGKLREIFDRLVSAKARIDAIVSALSSASPPVIDPRTADGMRQITRRLRARMSTMLLELESPTVRGTALEPPPAEQPWGWPPWMVFPLNFIYLLQVMLNSQGRGVGEQCQRLLGARSLRLGPVSLLPTNEAAMLLLLGLDEVAIAFGELTALLWRVTWPAELASWLGFHPGFRESLSWVESAWTPAAE
ncbi:MAG: patatin-like phospholipase family protein [Byssovorax sp.]